jgi:hypothetical protein
LRALRVGAAATALILAGCESLPEPGAADATPALAPEVRRLYGALLGPWQGTLEYRDLRTERRVRLPTLLTVTRVSGTDALRFDYVHDDGPGKTARSSDRGRVDLDARVYQVQSLDGSNESTYRIESVRRSDSPYGEELVLVGPSIENNRPVDTRITLTVTEQSLRVLREARLANQPHSPWLFRHEYVLSRR